MKIEYLDKGAADYPVIMIYGAQSFDALITAFKELSNGGINEIYVQKLMGFEAIDNCSLLLLTSDRDEEIKTTGKKNNFIWSLTSSTWDDLAALIEPFSKFDGHYFQWLAGGETRMGNLANSKIALVISSYPDGQW